MKFFRCSRFSEFDSNNKTAISEKHKKDDLTYRGRGQHFPGSTYSFQIQYQSDGMTIERFHSRDQRLCKFMGTKESVYIRKEINSHRIGLGHQHGRRFIVLEHQYGAVTSGENAL